MDKMDKNLMGQGQTGKPGAFQPRAGLVPSIYVEAEHMTPNIEEKRKWAQKRRDMRYKELIVEDEKITFSANCILGAIVLACVLIIMAFLAGKACASEIPEDVAVRVLIGEAANQGEKGMICVAEVLRQRGSTKGFYGIKAKHINSQPAWVWEQAKRAWRKSASTNYTNNATHYENVKAFGRPYWSRSMKVVYRFKDHTFFLEKRADI